MNSETAGMTAVDALRLALWKLRLASRRAADRRLGGHARRAARGADWASGWRAAYAQEARPLEAWRSREGAGRLWLPADPVAWARETCTPHDLAHADASVRGVFNLLGSGPVSLGDPPAWRRDLYSDREWACEPLDHRALARGDGSDVRTVWELSRCRHFLALARAHAFSGDVRYRETFVRHVTSWIADNPIGLGPHWLSPMDAGIRAANWILAAEIFARDGGIPAAFWEAMLANLYATGLFVERYPEWHPVYRGNHYVANGISLLYLGVFFGGTSAGTRWLRRGAAIVQSEIRYQVGDDRVSFEGSLAYHRFVTECFAWGEELRRRNLPCSQPSDSADRLRGMFAFIANYLPPSGLAPMLGDADDGRLHAISAEGEDEPRRHRLGLPDGYWPEAPAGPAAYPQGGFYVLRGGDDHLVVRCGRVGLRGAGSHDHNDQLSFELCIAGRRIVADSGTFAYTRDLAARFAFRATAAHSVVQIGYEEQNPIATDRPWRILLDRAAATCLRWEAGAERQVFEGEHYGFAHRASRAVCRRSIVFEPVALRWTLIDDILGRQADRVTWRLHLTPGEVRSTQVADTVWEVVLPGIPAVRMRIDLPPALRFAIVRSPASDRYGVRHDRPCLVASGEGALPMRVHTIITRADV